MSEAVSQTLVWVNEELGPTLLEARQALEDFIERPENSASLARCADRMHQAHGALKLGEVEGGALLAEEMEHVARHLLEDPTDLRRRTEGLDALTRAMVQLPAYMDRVISGGADIPMVLLPLLNDLRAARGQPLLSENTLVLLNLPADRSALSARRDSIPASGESPQQMARRYRAQYQSALLGWIRAQNPDSSLAVMADVISELERAATEDRCFQLWWITGGVIEALRQGGVESSASIKRLLGQVDLQIRRLVSGGESALESDPPFELINALLFYIARSSTRGKRVAEIRKTFSLDDLIPEEDDLDSSRDSLSAPSVKLMQTVGAAIREDLTRVKDVLDIFVRTGMERVEDLGRQLDLLRKIGDTLGVLGLGAVKDAVGANTTVLQEIVSGEREPDEELLLGIAANLIEVEDNLDGRLVGLIVEDAHPVDMQLDLDEMEARRDFEQVTAAVLRECIVNLDRVKEAIVQALEAPLEPQVLDEVPFLLRGITAGLVLLDRSRAVAAVERIGGNIRRWLAIGDAVPSMQALERLADAIVSVEYYMETIQSGRSDPMHMLDNAETCLAALDAMPREPMLPPRVAAESSVEETVQLPIGEPTRVMPGMPLGEGASAAGEVTRVMPGPKPAPLEPPSPPPRVGPEAGSVDTELLELFIEEAGELCEGLVAEYPAWESNRDQKALAEIRRQFHTLKGSGRMVGAELIGEFAWGVENLLNRVIAGTVEASEAIVAFVGRAIEAVPSLIEQLETGSSPAIDVQAYAEQARAFAESRPEAEQMLERTLAGFAEPVETVAAGEMDPVLRDIFTKEASGHLEILTDYIVSRQSQPAPHPVSEELHRACHTLSGAANMAGVAPAVAIAAPMNQLIRRLNEDEAGLTDSALALCRDAAALIASIIDDVRADRVPSADLGELPERFQHEYSEYVLRAEAAEEPIEEIHAPLAAAEVPGIQLDPEIAAIFVEEATELLDHADAVFSAWREQPRTQQLEELQRHLHTLKGGARLAGVATVGDLSHRLETVVEGLAEGRIGISESVGELIHQTLDELHAMREVVENGNMPEARDALLERLDAVSTAEPAGEPTVVADEFHVETLFGTPAGEPVPEEAVPEVAVPEELLPEDVFPGEVRPEDVVPEEVFPQEAFPEEGLPEETVEAFPVGTPFPDEEVAGGPGFDEGEVEVPRRPTLPAEFIPPPAVAPQLWAIRPPAAPEIEPELPAEAEEAVPRREALPTEFIPPPAAASQLRATGWPPAEELPTVEGLEPGAEQAAEAAEAAEAPAAEEFIPWTPPEEAREEVAEAEALRVSHPAIARPEIARVDADLLESLLNNAGEVSIFRSRLEQQIGSLDFNLEELSQTVTRLRDQLRNLEMETEAQILHRHHEAFPTRDDFDPLEMDRYSTIQQLSRALAETSSDVASLQQLLAELTRDAETLLTQQSRVITELQDGLMRTRMVPFSRHAQRLNRIVRQAAREANKEAELHIHGGTAELDRQVIDRALPAFEHLLRNAVIHGIETPDQRRMRDKSLVGRIDIRLRREGAEMTIEIADDGGGLDVDAIRRRAELQGLIQPGEQLSDDAAADLILKPGFSTAVQLTQSAGRGVGLDVVATAVRELGGSLRIDTQQDKGTRFLVRLPYTRAITQALIVRCGGELFALPLPTVEGVVRLPAAEVARHIGGVPKPYRYGDRDYHFRHLSTLVDGEALPMPEGDTSVPVVLIRAGERSTALLTDEMLGAREIVVKTLGPQLTGIPGISGATILGDGSIVVILDANALVRSRPEEEVAVPASTRPETRDQRTYVMVVDDSITVRRVTERLLERNGMRVITAKDGVDAVALLQDHRPDIILLDIEMPRMDGYEVANHVRNDPQLKNIPIVMITSRVGEKHPARAMESGVDDYLGKPYQESQLLAAIEALTGDRLLRSGHD